LSRRESGNQLHDGLFQDLALILKDEIVRNPEELACLHDLALDHDLF
jgi:hypothetical protein